MINVRRGNVRTVVDLRASRRLAETLAELGLTPKARQAWARRAALPDTIADVLDELGASRG